MMHPSVKPIVYKKGRGQGLERKALGLFVFTKGTWNGDH
ncbi:hypothetical protein SAMN05878482_102926 [Peribacillus simplex]|uniref:Uncharacterized protein n=1 Tax=Peribacillus simplex TaxID=1478 RepID=A0A9X8WKB5_9BACI|nr:hypothetical protein SAMN05878482_102926 [Peribacillus simplex]